MILVFWLPRLWALIWIVFFFVIVVIRDLIYSFSPLSVVTSLCFLDFGGRIGGIPLVFVLVLFFISLGLIKRLGILGRNRHRSLSLGFVFAMIFYCSLSLEFVCSSVCQLAFLRNLLIDLLYIKTFSSTHFCLGFYRFCY